MSDSQNRRRFLRNASLGAVTAAMIGKSSAREINSMESVEKNYAERKSHDLESTLEIRPHDRQIWEEELEEFVPKRVFDAHCHLVSRVHVSSDSPSLKYLTETPLSTLKSWESQIFPGRETHFLALGKPAISIDIKAHNHFLGEEIAHDPLSRANCLTSPRYPVEQLAKAITAHGFVGLKVYRYYSVTGDIANCRIHDFLPHEQMELADDLGLWITLHLSRSDGCADKYNLDDLEEYTTKRYPRIKWILAHCARSFTYYPIQQAIDRLRDMPNIWYDLSAVTDALPFCTLFRRENLKRIFYGSDAVDAVSFHGKYVVLGRAWQTFRADDSGMRFPHCKGRPILAVYEQLLAIKNAARIADLSQDDVEDIFWRNAVNALDIRLVDT